MVVLMKAGIQRPQGIIEAKNAVFFGNLEFGLAVQIFRNQPQIGRKELSPSFLERLPQCGYIDWDGHGIAGRRHLRKSSKTSDREARLADQSV